MKPLSIKLLDLYLNDEFYGWGFSLFKLEYEMNDYSLFEFCVRWPNVRSEMFKIKFDFLFLNSYIELYHSKLIDISFINKNKLSGFQKLTLNILNYIYR